MMRRSCVVIFWIALFLSCLYLPKWISFETGEKSITVFAWGDILEPSVIQEFEEKTGIKVRMLYYGTNQELMVKLKATQGRGYDLILPTDYMVTLLAKEDLIQPLERAKIEFFDRLNPSLTNRHFDPNNVYSVPFSWESYGFGVNKAFYEKRNLPASWRLIFDPTLIDYRITTLNDPIDVVAIASNYLFGQKDSLNPEQLSQIKDLLLEQKRWTEAYVDFRGDYFLLTGNCPVVVATSSYIARSMTAYDYIDFVIPEDGMFICVENLCIPKASQKQELVYEFMNFLFSKKSVATHFENFGIFPSTLQAYDDIDMHPTLRNLLQFSVNNPDKLLFLKELVSQKDLHDMWISLKVARVDQIPIKESGQ